MLDLLVAGIDELWTMDDAPDERGVVAPPLQDGAVGFQDGRVAWVGPSRDAPPARRVLSGRGCVGLPGLVDCHTHALYAGSRAAEFEQRLAGADYSEILAAGGGIHATVRATRDAPEGDLAVDLDARLRGWLALGVTTVEVKTGYALEPEAELRHLRLLAGRAWPVRVVPTCLAAHVVPPDQADRREAWVTRLVEELLPAAVGLARCVDVYCDRGAYTLEEARRILQAARSLGFVGRIHAEQVEHTGAAGLAAELGCASADHLERARAADLRAMAAAGTVAVLLPGAMLYLRDRPPPVRSMRRAGVRMAVATDFNPGTSPVADLWACATLATLTMGLRVDEALAGITRHAAAALGREDLGWLAPGNAGDLALFRPPPGEPPRAAVLVQHLGGHRAEVVIRDGRPVVAPARRWR